MSDRVQDNSEAFGTAAAHPQWIVSSGGHQVKASGVDVLNAAVAALKTETFDSLGLIMRVWPANEEPNDDNTYFVLSENVCKAAGMWGYDTAASVFGTDALNTTEAQDK